MASFTQDAMIRGFDDNGAQSAIPAGARLLPLPRINRHAGWRGRQDWIIHSIICQLVGQ
jgi:hypothetical protein